ncbi:hypothetical protein [Engelhardtia mirabilis]|uniref:Sulfatase n=1 Tax=Engelhardtia mirabilis TaxID=2528011 RepID=A0A518BKY2_9BACT|nr:Sulfatase [Planctomycetes bacterium Pla133]QDV01960.1 Sulfatase [Planctomycetes bacterium Pla86]
MNRTRRTLLALALLPLLGACSKGDKPGGDAPAPGATKATPGGTATGPAAMDVVVLVTVDGLYSDDVTGLRPNAPVLPSLGKLARSGATFMAASSASVDPAAALVSVLSGLHPASHGATAAGDRRAANPALPRLASVLGSVGWRTRGLVPSDGGPALALGARTGFDRVDAVPGPAGQSLRTAAGLMGDLASTQQPTLLWVHVAGLRDVAAPVRDAALVDIDAAIGDVAQTMVSTGVAKRSLLVVTGVAPTPLAGRADLGPLAPVVSCANAVPLIVCAQPELVKPKTVAQRPVGGVDIVATIAQMAGVTWPLELDGRSFAPDLRGELEWAGPVWIDTAGIKPFAASLRWGNLELAAVPGGAQRLHDVTADPRCEHDVAASRAAGLVEHMSQWSARILAGCKAKLERYPAVAPGS